MVGALISDTAMVGTRKTVHTSAGGITSTEIDMRKEEKIDHRTAAPPPPPARPEPGPCNYAPSDVGATNSGAAGVKPTAATVPEARSAVIHSTSLVGQIRAQLRLYLPAIGTDTPNAASKLIISIELEYETDLKGRETPLAVANIIKNRPVGIA